MIGKLNRVVYTGVIALLTLGVLLSGYFFYNKYFINQPLSTVLENSNIITSYELSEKSHSPLLKLKLSPTVNFAKEFQNFLNNNEQMLSKKPIYLELQSNPNKKILKFYEEAHPVIYETLSLGNYSHLQEKINYLAQDYGLTKPKLTIDDKYLYLQLEDKENYLYLMFNRSDEDPLIVNGLGSDFL